MTLSIDNQARINQLELLYTRLKVKTEKTIISDTEPENPTIGTAWFDTTELTFKTWNWRTWDSWTASSLTIWSSPDWFRVDWDGNMWSGRADLSTAQTETFAVLKTGELFATNATISWNITITGWNTNLDAIDDGSTYKRVTWNEKTGAGRWYSALNSNSRYKTWLSAGEMTSATLPSNGVVFWSQGIVWRKSWVTTFELKTNWDAFFKGTIFATWWEIEWLLDITWLWSIRTWTDDDWIIIWGETIFLRNTILWVTTINSIKAFDDWIQVAGNLVCVSWLTMGANIDMDNNEIINSWNIILPTWKYFAVQDGSGLVLDWTFHKIYYSSGKWQCTDSLWTFDLNRPTSWGWGWVWTATSHLNMASFNIFDVNDFTADIWWIVTLNWKLRIPVWTDLY